MLLFGVGIACVVAPLTTTLMGSIPGRFSGLGSAINNAIARVGQPLLGAIVFVAISATFYTSLESQAPELDTQSPEVRSTFSPLNPPKDSATPEQVEAANSASIEAFHQAMLVGAGLLVVGAAVSWFGLRDERSGRAVDAAEARRRRPDDEAPDHAPRLGRPNLRPRRRSDDPLGCDRAGSPAAPRRRARPGCRLRQRPGHRAAGRAPAATAGSIALDGSASMIEAARERLARFGDRIEYVVADLGVPLPIEGTVDAILSTATFHWVPDHDALFANLAAVMRPGGWLVAQCGGAGNIASIKRVLATIGDGWLGPAHFETAEATTRRLEAAGFVDIECWLHDEPTRFEAGEPFETYLRTVVLGAHLERLPPAEHDAFVHAVAEGVGEPVIDYVRLNILARRAGD